jgi:Flp pilus assembly protein TadB
MEIVVSLVHAGVGAIWLGSMAYSLFVAQPRIARVLAAGQTEDVYRELAAGNRWRVVALIATLALSGLALVAIVDRPAHPGLWWSLVAAKMLFLVLASAAFWWVSWRGWPRRVFALPAELPAQQRRFRRVAVLMCGLVGAAFALGVIAEHL